MKQKQLLLVSILSFCHCVGYHKNLHIQWSKVLIIVWYDMWIRIDDTTWTIKVSTKSGDMGPQCIHLKQPIIWNKTCTKRTQRPISGQIFSYMQLTSIGGSEAICTTNVWGWLNTSELWRTQTKVTMLHFSLVAMPSICLS